MRALRGLYLTVGVVIGVLFPFVPVVLAVRGFSAPQIGLVMALTAVGYVVGLPAWGHLGDVVLGRRRALEVAALGSAAAALLFGLPLALPLVAAACVGYYVMQSGAGMLTDAMTVNALGDRADRYGRFRLLESASFAVATLAAGTAYDAVGYGLSYGLAAASAVLVALMAMWVADAPRAQLSDYAPPPADPLRGPVGLVAGAGGRSATAVEPARDPLDRVPVAVGYRAAEPERAIAILAPPPLRGARDASARVAEGFERRTRLRLPARWETAGGSLTVALTVAPRLIGVLAAVILVHLAVLASFTFLPLRLMLLGSPPSVIAWSSALSAVFEIPAMFGASRLVPRVGLRGLFVAGCLLYAAAFLAWIVLSDPVLIVVSRVLTGFGYGALTVGIVLTVGAMLPARLQASGQALYGMSALGIASIISNLGGGVVFGAYGHVPVFAAAAVAALAATVVAWRFFPARGEVRLGSQR